MRGLLLLLLVLAGARCTHAASAPLTAAAPTRWPEPEPPALRLPDTVRPVHYTLDLTLLPAEPTDSGTVTVDLDVREATQQVWLHAEGLTLTHARVRSGARVLEARTVDGGEGRLGVLLPEPLAAGTAQLSLGFTAHADRVRSQGLYAVKEGGEPALYTFFEPTDARRASRADRSRCGACSSPCACARNPTAGNCLAWWSSCVEECRISGRTTDSRRDKRTGPRLCSESHDSS